MSSIRLVANLIPGTNGTPAGGWGHFQLVYVADDGGQTELEVQAPNFPILWRNWLFEAPDDHTTAQNTPNFNIEGAYAWTQLDLGERDPAAVWSILVQAHQQFQASGLHIPYTGGFNSNSYATALVSVLGGLIEDFIPGATPSMVFWFPGAGTNPLDYRAWSPNFTLYGSNTPDTIVGGAGHDVLFGLGGNDALYGQAGDDRIFGGGGYDLLVGGDGADIIESGAYNDSIYLGAWNGEAMVDDGDADIVVVGQGWDFIWDAGVNDILAVRYEIANLAFQFNGGALLIAINPEEGQSVFNADNVVSIENFEDGDFGIFLADGEPSLNFLDNFVLFGPPADDGAFSDQTPPGGGWAEPGASGVGTIPQVPPPYHEWQLEEENAIDDGGEWRLNGATPDGVEGLRLTHSAGTTLHLFDPSQWTLIRGALGSDDLIDIGDWSPTTGAIFPVVTGLAGVGVERVT